MIKRFLQTHSLLIFFLLNIPGSFVAIWLALSKNAKLFFVTLLFGGPLQETTVLLGLIFIQVVIAITIIHFILFIPSWIILRNIKSEKLALFLKIALILLTLYIASSYIGAFLR